MIAPPDWPTFDPSEHIARVTAILHAILAWLAAHGGLWGVPPWTP